MWSKVTFKKSDCGIEAEKRVEQEFGLEFSLMGINREGGFTFASIEKVTSTQTSAPVKSELIVWPPQQQEPRKREPDGQVVSIRRAADESREIVNEKK